MTTTARDDASAGPTALHGRVDRLRIRHLRLLDLLVRTGTLTAVGELMHISQPAVTKMLQELEQAFGCTLIERTSRGGRLNPAGERALERLRIALGAVDAASEALAVQAEVPLVRMGVLPLVEVEVLPKLVAALHQRNTLPRMQLHEHTVNGLLAMLMDGAIDCVIGRLEPGQGARTPECLRIAPLWDEQLAVACAPAHPFASRRNVNLSALRASAWVLPPRGTHTREMFEQPFVASGQLPPMPRIESASFHSNLSMVAVTDFLTVAPESAVRHYASTSMVRQVRVATPFSSGKVVFITHRDVPRTSSVSLILDALRQGGAPAARAP